MLTLFTQVSIALLQDISSGTNGQSAQVFLPKELRLSLLGQLVNGKLIRCCITEKKDELSSYQLCRPLDVISLLDILEALKEPINCTQTNQDWLQTSYPIAVQKLGTLNHLMRRFCSEIKLSDW